MGRNDKTIAFSTLLSSAGAKPCSLSFKLSKSTLIQVDPNANNCYPPPPPPPISHSRTHSGPVGLTAAVQYTPVECGANQTGSAELANHPGGEVAMVEGGTQYSSLVSNANASAAAGSSEYMAMSPPNATPTTAG